LEEVVSQVNLYKLLNKPIADTKIKITMPFTIRKEVVDAFIKNRDKDEKISNMMYT
jgi:hypothetical protein